MAPTTPSGPPVHAVAGDSWRWKVSDLPYHPQSEGWSLKYELAGRSKTLTITPTWQTSGDDIDTWLATAATTDTNDLDAGTYTLSARVVGSGEYDGREETIDVRTGRAIDSNSKPWYMAVNADPRTAAAGDFLLRVEEDIEKLEAAIAGRLTKQDESYAIGGRSISKIPYMQLESLCNQKRAIRDSILYGRISQPIEVTFRRA